MGQLDAEAAASEWPFGSPAGAINADTSVTYSAQLPCATEPGEYTIYCKVIGDVSHVDSQVQTVTSTITEKGSATRAGLAKSGDAMSYAIPAATALVALAAAALAFAARRRTHD